MEIQLFNNPQFGEIRTAGDADHPLFCLADLCRALELGNPSQVKGRLTKKESQLIDLHALYNNEGGVGNSLATFVTESGLYKVIFQSRKPEAEAFTSWVTEEVLPSIRKTGGYIPVTPEETPQETLSRAFLIATETIKLREQRIQMLEGKNALLEQENQELAPKAQYADDVLQSSGTYTHSEMAKELNFRSWVAFIDACKKDGILFKHQGGMYMLYAKYSGKGYMKTRTNTFTHKDGSIGTSVISVWTEAGRHFLHEHFNVALQPVDFTMFNLEKDL